MARILILSDDPDDRQLYALILEQKGYECITVLDLQDALSHLRNFKIDVLYIVGLHSFGSDGLEFYRQLKSEPQLCKIPVIIYIPRFLSDLKPTPADCGDTLFVMPMAIWDLIEKVKELTSIEK